MASVSDLAPVGGWPQEFIKPRVSQSPSKKNKLSLSRQSRPPIMFNEHLQLPTAPKLAATTVTPAAAQQPNATQSATQNERFQREYAEPNASFAATPNRQVGSNLRRVLFGQSQQPSPPQQAPEQPPAPVSAQPLDQQGLLPIQQIDAPAPSAQVEIEQPRPRISEAKLPAESNEQAAAALSLWASFKPNQKRGDQFVFGDTEAKLQYALSFYHERQPRPSPQEASDLINLVVAPINVENMGDAPIARLVRLLKVPSAAMQWLVSAKDPGFPDFVPWPGEPFRVALVRYLRFRVQFQRYHITMANLAELWKAHEADPGNQAKKQAFEQSLRRFMKKHRLKIKDSRSLKRKGTSQFFDSSQRQAELLKYFTDNPKATLDRALSHFNSPNLSKSALYRAMKVLGLAHQNAHYIDPRAEPYRDKAGKLVDVEVYNSEELTKAQMRRRQITTQERYEFADKQREPNNILNIPARLLFMDETTLQLNLQQKKAWGADAVAPLLPKQKGPTSQTVQLMLIIGVRPRNPQTNKYDDAERALVIYGTRITKSEFIDDELISAYDERIMLNYDPDDVLGDASKPIQSVAAGGKYPIPLTKSKLESYQNEQMPKKLLDILGVSSVHTGSNAPLTKEQMIARLLTVASKGRVGLPIANKLRAKEQAADKVTTNEVAAFLRDQVRQQWKTLNLQDEDLTNRVLVWDNSVSHDAPRAPNTHKRSWFHDHIGRLCGIQSVVFTPQYTPGKNPAEAAFAFIKRDVRANCPQRGVYTTKEMIAQIERSIKKITPAMIRHWVHGCGYGRKRLQNNQERQAAADACDPSVLKRTRHVVECAIEDSNGRVGAPVMKRYAHNNKAKNKISKWRFIDKPAALRAFAQSKGPNPVVRLRDVSAGSALVKRRIELHKETLEQVKKLSEQEQNNFQRRWVGAIRPPINELQSSAPPALKDISAAEKRTWHTTKNSWKQVYLDNRKPPVIGQSRNEQKQETERKKRNAEMQRVKAAQPKENEPGTFEVEYLKNDGKYQGRRVFLVKWKHLKLPTWEWADNISEELISSYYKEKNKAAQQKPAEEGAKQPTRKREQREKTPAGKLLVSKAGRRITPTRRLGE
jgi:transposase